MKKYLGIDLGSKSLGLAISESGIIANSYDTLYFEEDNYDEAAIIIETLILKLSITDCIIGLPKHMNNDLGIRGEISVNLKEKLEELIPNTNFILWDERSTTKQALDVLIKGNVSRKKTKSFKRRACSANYFTKLLRLNLKRRKIMKENQITLINEDGSESLAEIILTHEANDKKYIIFEILETEEVSAAIFVEDGNEGKFLDIETDEEWDMLDKLLDNFYDSLEDSEEDDLED